LAAYLRRPVGIARAIVERPRQPHFHRHTSQQTDDATPFSLSLFLYVLDSRDGAQSITNEVVSTLLPDADVGAEVNEGDP
jgi:hypothetical protein